MVDKRNKNTRKPQFASSIDDTDEAYRAHAEALANTAVASDTLLVEQRNFDTIRDDIEKEFTAEKEKEMLKKMTLKVKAQMRHEARLDIEEEHRKTLIEEKKRLEAKVYEETTSKIEKEAQLKMTKELVQAARQHLKPYLRKEVEVEVKAAHKKELEKLKASYSEELDETKGSLERERAEMRAEIEKECTARAGVYEQIILEWEQGFRVRGSGD